MIEATDLRSLSVQMATVLLEVAWQYKNFLLPTDRNRYLELGRTNGNVSSAETHIMQMAEALVSILQKYGGHIPDAHQSRIDQTIYQYWRVTGNRIGPME